MTDEQSEQLRQALRKAWSGITGIVLNLPPDSPKLAEARDIYFKYDRQLRELGIL